MIRRLDMYVIRTVEIHDETMCYYTTIFHYCGLVRSKRRCGGRDKRGKGETREANDVKGVRKRFLVCTM